MYRKQIPSASLFGVMITAVALIAAAPPPRQPVAATVNGQPIYETTVRRSLSRVPAVRRAETRPDVVEHLVNNMLIDQALRAAGYKVESWEEDQKVGELRLQLKRVGRDFDALLASLQVSEPKLREQITADLRWFKYANALATDHALQAFFNANTIMFDGSMVKVQHILITPTSSNRPARDLARKKAHSIRTAIESEVRGGLDNLPRIMTKRAQAEETARLWSSTFGKFAKKYSSCPSKVDGGVVGPFPRVGAMVEPFAAAAFALKPFTMSEVVQTPFGYHVILVTERQPGREVRWTDTKKCVKAVYCEQLRSKLATKLRRQAKVILSPHPVDE
jgi:hypothetical protein